jgi:hypothetical protein
MLERPPGAMRMEMRPPAIVTASNALTYGFSSGSFASRSK